MMKRPGLDYEKLVEFVQKKNENSMEQLGNKVAADNIRHRMHKVAFDVYNVENDPYDSLWRLECNADDGKEYLIRMDNDEPTIENKTGGWSATSTESASSITLAYKGMPLQRLSSKIFGFNKEDVGFYKKALVEKVSKDSSFRDKILNMQSEDRKKELVKIFPELFIK